MIEESFDFIPYAQAPANKHLAEKRLDSVTSRSNVSLIEKPLDSSDTWIPVRGKDLVPQGGVGERSRARQLPLPAVDCQVECLRQAGAGVSKGVDGGLSNARTGPVE